MYFKSLELFGFKSFAGRTRVDFEPGITAIVGPNGCGKSNILDSMKWVLGEQSAKDLRGLNMTDVIFNGTDTKDPVGFAEVSLTLSNASRFLPIEYEEVVITRRLFRSGDSEYLLNKNQVRLKDILELFMGTGVGTSAYSIIEQGKIDMIISSKPEDRRYIFEEASGIIKYKSKKREAARKLEYTENNLLRINDIIEEVKRQIGSIERQARKAERYKEEFERLKALDTKAAFLEFTKLSEGKQDVSGKVSDLKKDESSFLSGVSELSSKLGALKADEARITSRLSDAQFKEMNLNSNVERSKDKIKLDEERSMELEALKQSLLNEQAQARKAISELEKAVSELNKETEAVSGGKTQKEALLTQRRSRLKNLEEEFRRNEQNIRSGKLRIVDVLSAHSKKRNDLAKLSSDLSNLQARQRRLKIEEEEAQKESASIREQLAQIDKEVSDLVKGIADTKTAHAELESELGRSQQQLSEVEKRIEDIKSQRLSLESKLALLKDMVRRYEGFASGSKAILVDKQENRLSITGVYGAIAELIEVERGYEAAVEAALGELISCIVVENKTAAIDLINYLKGKNSGKATIVALDSIESMRGTQAGPAPQEGVLGRLTDFIKTEARFRDLVSVLFSNVYLVKDTGVFLNIKPESAANNRFVTAAGEIYEMGFLTGGAVKNEADAGILNRRLQIQEIETELVKIRQETSVLESRRELLTKEGNELVSRITAQTEALRRDEILLANKNNQKENMSRSLKKITDEISLLALELQETAEEINSLTAKQTVCEAELKRLDEENSAMQNTIASAQLFIETAIKEKEGLLIEVTKIETELANITEQENSFLSNLNMRRDLLNSQKALLNEKEKNYNEAAIRQEELKNEMNALQTSIDEAVIEKEKISIEFQDVKNEKSELEKLIARTGAEFKEKEKELNSVKDRAHNLEMALQENSFKLETLKTRISQAYKIELEQFSAEIEEGFNPEAVSNEISALREKIEKMGPVNLVAIEEHQELKERFDFLTKQREDLTNAKESLLEAIKKINKTTRELFMDTFQKVRVEFKEYFRYLFGGGQAELVLMDEEDVLECGIEIMARPPGKKLQSISLLSGGEKALTAIALLFSIFKVKPSPFCILDEVDAPLDESNIGRFTKMLSEFTKTSQFIIITHNKKTISMADVMYGITMEQSGISKVVSVKFAKDKEEKVNADSRCGR